MFSKYLGDRGFWSTTLRLAVPIALQNLLISSFSLVDTIMVGQLGDVSLSAVGMASQWTWLLNIVLFGICSGVSIFVAQYWGVKDIKGIHRVYGIGILSSAVLSALFLIIGFAFPREVMLIFNREPAVVTAGSAYMRIAVFSYPAVVLSSLFGIVLRSTERVKLPLVVSLVSTILNALMNYALIFGKFGMPTMGIEGAAVATVISAWVGPIIYLVVSVKQRNLLIASPRDLFSVKMEDIRRFYKRAAPVLFNEALWGGGTFCFSIIFSNLGYENYAAVTVLRTFENVMFAFSIGLCNACCIMLGKSIGEGKTERAVEDARRFSVLVPLLSVFLSALVILFRHPLVQLFNLTDNITAYTIEIAQWLMVIYALEMPVRQIPFIQIVGIFRSGGETKVGMIYDTVCLLGISLPLTLLAAFVLKLPFLLVYAIMYVGEDYLKAYLCIRYLRTYRWIKPVTEQGKQGLAKFMEARAAGLAEGV